MRLIWALPLTLLLVTVLAAVAQGAPQAYQTVGACDEAQVDGVAGDANAFYVGRADGYVNAVDRTNGRTLWTYPTHYEPVAGARDLVVDDTRVYVVYTDVTNGVEDPVIALDKDTGAELWRATTSKNDLTKALDPFRIVQDSTHVYVGKDGGQIVKLDKATGKVAKIGSVDAVFTPANWDTPDSNGIWAMTIGGDGNLYAARNWSNRTDVEVMTSYVNNSIIVVNKATMAGAPYELTSGGQNLDWAVFGLYADDATGSVFIAGSGRGTNEDHDRPRTMGFIGQAPQATGDLAMGQYRLSGDGHLAIGETDWTTQNPNVVTHFLSIDGDATHIYVGTGLHPDAGQGYALKLNRGDLTVADWGTARHLGSGFVRDIEVLDDAVIAGGSCIFLGLGHAAGLAAEMPKQLAPMPVIVTPSAGELTNGKMDLALRVHFPTTYVGQVTAKFFVAPNGGNCADGQSCYVPLELYTDDQTDTRLRESFFMNQLKLFKDIDLTNLPSGADYMLRVEVVDELGRKGYDFAEFGFLADYAPPTVSDTLPLPDSLIQDRRPIISATYRDDLALVAADKITLNINDRPVTPLLDRFFDENGIRVDLGAPELAFLGLREGANNIELVVPDRSGNLAVKTWQVRLDSKVKAPVLNPATDSFVREVRPILGAQFFEPIQPLAIGGVIFEGQDVTDQTDIIGPQGGLGTRLLFRPTTDLSPGKLYSITFTVKDEIGNEGGPYKARFRVDAAPPVVANRLPAQGALITEDRPDIRFTLQDAGSGLQENTVNVFMDGKDVTRDVERSTSLYEYQSKVPLRGGDHTITVTALDVAGNIVSESWTFRIDVEPPVVRLDLELPAGQSAVKAGDTVVVRATIADASPIRAVRMDVRSLDPTSPPSVTPASVPGQPGVYELPVTVKDTRTRAAYIFASADDLGGLVSRGEASVLIDNNPPQSQLKPLPAFVGASFELSWENTPRDDAVGGSGIAYYRVERQTGEGPWQVRFPRHESTSIVEEALDGAFVTLNYRVFAVDKAGNVQPAPSNVVTTVVRGDPFPSPEFETTLLKGASNLIRASPTESLPLGEGLAFVTMRGADGEVHEFRMDAYGRLYMATLEFEDLEPGDYLLRLHFRDAQGFEMNSRTYTVQLKEGAGETEQLQESKNQESPGLPLGVAASALLAAAFVSLRRRNP